MTMLDSNPAKDGYAFEVLDALNAMLMNDKPVSYLVTFKHSKARCRGDALDRSV
jgi:hypothetical protein